MSRDLTRINVIDVEATCWPTENPSNIHSHGKKSEIIEVGLTELIWRIGEEGSWELGDSFSYVCFPEYSDISQYCTDLTGHTEESVSEIGRPFSEVLKTLRKTHKSKDRLWSSYGAYDASIFQRNCEEKFEPYPFGKFHINIKALMEFKFGQTLGMEQALERMNLPLLGRHHSGMDDSRNTAILLQRLFSAAEEKRNYLTLKQAKLNKMTSEAQDVEGGYR